MSIAAKINAVLLLMIVLLSGVIWVSQQPERMHPLLPTLSIENIEHITVTPFGQPEMRLHKQAGRWLLATLEDFPANADVLKHLMALTQAEILSDYALPELRSEFGLARGVVITFNAQSVTLGKLDPVRKQRYVQANERLYLIFDRYSHHLQTSLVSPKLLPEEGQLEQVELPHRVLKRDPNGWQSSPELAAKTLQNSVNLWTHAEAQKVVLLSQAPSDSNVVLQLEHQRIRYWFDAQEKTLTRLKPAIRYYLSDTLIAQLMPHKD